MADFTMKQGDRLPALTATLTDADDAAVDLSSGVDTITFSMRPKQPGPVVVSNAAASATDAAGGVVQYEWAAGDTAAAGEYVGEFTVNYTGGSSLTFPNLGYIRIHIESQIA